MTSIVLDAASPEMVQKVMLVPGNVDRKLMVTGIKFDANQNTTTDYDKTFAETREIQGAWLEVANHEPGDYVELFICMPDDTPVGQFGESIYIPPSKKVEQIVSEGTVSFPSGFKLRMTYVAVDAGITRAVYGWYRMRK
jgi:hypothetical protein